MSRQLSESAIVQALAARVSQRLTRKVIAFFQDRTDALLSGDDSVLQNTWDEICVQVQCQQSFFWDAYDWTVRSLVAAYVDELPEHEREALWLQTPQGIEWARVDNAEREPYPVDNDNIIGYLVHGYIYAEADRWSNARIRTFRELHYARD